MILAESLHPALVRRGVNGEVKHVIARCSPEDFNTSSAGIWLPPDFVATAEHATTNQILAEYAPHIGHLALGKSGCWLTEEDVVTNEEALRQVSYIEVGNMMLNAVEDLTDLRLCDETTCAYGRHYDLTYSCDSQRRALLEPDPRFYTLHPNGSIHTIWGDILPSVADSATKLRELQLRCPPYVSEKTSPLTTHNIGQITLHPLTGCWVVRTFYTRPGYQYDGYGRLSRRAHMAPKNARVKSMQMLAHRVIWQVTGNQLKKGQELNHLCGHRPCANTNHLRQVSKRENGLHSYRMQRATLDLEAN